MKNRKILHGRLREILELVGRVVRTYTYLYWYNVYTSERNALAILGSRREDGPETVTLYS